MISNRPPAENSSRIDLLRQMPIFGGLEPTTLDLILEASCAVEVANGNWFFREGDRGHSVYVIEQGVVDILRNWRGRECELARLEAGDCFGEMALMDFCSRSASARAAEDSTAIEITCDTLRLVYQRDVAQFTIIQMNMGREVCRRLRKADQLLFKLKAEVDASDNDASDNDAADINDFASEATWW